MLPLPELSRTLLHVLYFVSIMLFFPISLLLPHSEPGYDWWWGEILVSSLWWTVWPWCGNLLSHLQICNSDLILLCSKSPCYSTNTSPQVSPFLLQFSGSEQIAVLVFCWGPAGAAFQNKYTGLNPQLCRALTWCTIDKRLRFRVYAIFLHPWSRPVQFKLAYRLF